MPVARLERWLSSYSQRHEPVSSLTTGSGWVLSGSGAVALLGAPAWLPPGAALPQPDALPGLAEGLCYVVLVVRRAGYLVAVVRSGTVVGSKVGYRHIHGRTAAGGWSQKRYARRRANQADEVAGAAAAALAALSPIGGLDFLVLAGDRELREQALAGLPGGLRGLRLGPTLAIGTPNRDDLAGLPGRVTALAISVWDTDVR